MRLITFTIILLFTSPDAFSQNYDWKWANGSGGFNGAEDAVGGVTDGNGNVYVIGNLNSQEIVIGSTTLVNNGLTDFFIAKYSTAGVPLWAHSFGGEDEDVVNAIAYSEDDMLYICGSFNSESMTIGSNGLSKCGGKDIYIAKFNTDGNVISCSLICGNQDDEATGAICDSFGNLYIAGQFRSPILSYSNGDLTKSIGHTDAFLIKFTSALNIVWAKSFATNLTGSYSYCGSLALDNSGNVYMTGEFGDDSQGYYGEVFLLIGSDTLYDNNVYSSQWGTYYYPSAFVLKLNSNGTYLNGYSDDHFYTGKALVTNHLGELFLSMHLQVDLMISLPSNELAIAKLDNNCNLVWKKTFQDFWGYNWCNGLSCDTNGDLLATGYYSSSFFGFDGDTMYTTINEGHYYPEIFIVKYLSNGTRLWTKQVGGSISDRANCIINDGNDNFYLLGQYESDTIWFDDHLLTNESDTGEYEVHISAPWHWRYPNFFVAKLSDITSHIAPVDMDNSLSIFPNPTTGFLHIYSEQELIEIIVYDLTSRVMLIRNHPDRNGSLDLSDLPGGIYFIQLLSNESKETQKIVVE